MTRAWSIFAIIGLLSGGTAQAPIKGYDFETKQECAEYFTAHGTRVGLGAQGTFRALKADRGPITYIKISCERA